MIGQYPLIPNQAFLYFPNQQQIVSVKSGKLQRNIFDGDILYTNDQQYQIKLFQQYLKKEKNVPVSIRNCYRPVLLRHLQATQFNHKECYQALQKLQKWQSGILPLRITSEIERILKLGVLYHCGRDCHYRPIFVIDVGRILKMKLKQKQIMHVLGYFFQYAIEHLLIEGQVQNWNSIIDLGNASVFSLGGTLVDTITFLSSMFRCRVNHSFLVNCPSSIKWIWGMVKSTLNQDQLRKISMTDKSIIENQAWKYISPTQIEKKYGGTLQNIHSFWPISVANHESIALHNEKLNSLSHGIMISIEQYNKKFEAQKLVNKKIKQSLIRKFCQQFHETTKGNFFKLSSAFSRSSRINNFQPHAKSKLTLQCSKKFNNQQDFHNNNSTDRHNHCGSIICQCVDIPLQENIPQIPDDIFLAPLAFHHHKW